MGTFHIRRATRHDLDTVIGLIDDAAEWLRGKNTDQWAEPWPDREARDNRVRMGIEAGQTWILFAEDGTAAATISAGHEGNPKLWSELELPDRAVYVQRLVINREYAGIGLGAQLIDWAGRQARRRYRAKWIRIDVWTTNFSLQSYYEDNGFIFLRYCTDPEYPAGALLQKPTDGIEVPAKPLFKSSAAGRPLLTTAELQRWQRRLARAARSNIATMAVRSRRIRLLLLMAASVVVAANPAIGSGQAAAGRIISPNVLAGYLIVALSAGTLAGLFLPARTHSLRATAQLIGAFGVAMVIFSMATEIWLSVPAALVAGGTAVLAGAATNVLLLNEVGRQRTVQVMAFWAMAIACGRPLVSLIDGWPANMWGARTAGLIVELPALAVGGLAVPAVVKWGRSYLAYRPVGSLEVIASRGKQ